VGQQALCTARFGRQVSKGKAQLESDELIFRGDFRRAIPFREMESVRAVRGQLRVRFPGGTASFDVGPQAESWAQKILHPKPLIDKLGVKPGAVVSVLGVRDASFRRQLRERTEKIAEARPREASAFVFLAAERAADLRCLEQLAHGLKKNGAVWVVYPKGQSRITQADVMAASKRAGLVDVKVVGFSKTHTALKLVIPVSRR
jgi:hypothetical protein